MQSKEISKSQVLKTVKVIQYCKVVKKVKLKEAPEEEEDLSKM